MCAAKSADIARLTASSSMTKATEKAAREWHESSQGKPCPHTNILQRALATDDCPFDQHGCMLCGFLAGYVARDKELEESPHDHYDHCCLMGEVAEDADPIEKAAMECKCRKAGHAAALEGLPTPGDIRQLANLSYGLGIDDERGYNTKKTSQKQRDLLDRIIDQLCGHEYKARSGRIQECRKCKTRKVKP